MMLNQKPTANVSDKARLVAKWKKMLEHKRMQPLSNRQKPIVAAILENLYKRSKGLLKEEKLTTADVQGFETVLIPMIRRIAPELIALDILGTQVMEKPSQLIFALRAIPSGRQPFDGFGYEIPGGRVRTLDGYDKKQGTKRAQILLMNKTDAGYFSANPNSGETSLPEIMANPKFFEKGYFKGIYDPTNLESDATPIKIYGRYVKYGKVIESGEEKTIVTEVGDKIVEGTVYYAEETKDMIKCIVCYDAANGFTDGDFNRFMTVSNDEAKLLALAVDTEVTATTLENCTDLSGCWENEIMYNVVFNNYSGRYSTQEAENFKTWNEVSFDIDSTMVKAESRLLKARYSLEVAEDLMAYHNLDAEEELVNMISYEILAEMNREIVDRIYTEAISNGNGIYTWNFNEQANLGTGRWSNEAYHSLYTLMNKMAGDIAISTRRGTANFAICSMGTKVALESLAGYSLWTDVNNNFNGSAGIVYAGVLGGKYKIYVDTFATHDYVLMGYKGSSEYDAGLFYCPFIPLSAVKAVNPSNFQPSLGFRTRYGLAANPFGANLYYRLCTIDGLDNSFGASYTYVPNN